MNNISKKIIVSLLTVLLIFSFAACGNNEQGETYVTAARTPNPTPKDLRGEITISAYRSAKYDDSIMDYISQIAFDYTGLEVVYDDNYTEEEYFSTLDSRIASGEIGDIYIVRDDDVAKLAESGKIIDLTDIASDFHDYSNNGYTRVELSEKVLPAAYQNATYNGRIYMVPTEYYHKYVFINYSMLRSAGIDEIPSDKWSWDEFVKYADAISSVGGKIVMDYTDYAVWGSFAEGFGGQIFKTNEDGTVDYSKVNLTSGDVVNGLNKLVNFVKSHNVQKKFTGKDFSEIGLAIVDRFETGLWNNTDDQYADWSIVDFDWDYMHMPRLDVHKNGAHTVGFVVKNSDETDEIKELAANVALYSLFDNAAVAYVGDGQVVPANKEVSSMKFWREWPVKGKNTSVFTSYETADFGACKTANLNLAAANQFNVGQAVEQAVGGGNLAGSLQAIQNAVNAAIK